VVAKHPIETIDARADEGRVPDKLVLAGTAVVVAAALFAVRVFPPSGPPAAAHSTKTSPCGQVGLTAEELGLGPTRALTLCLLNEERARRGLAPLSYEARLELASQRHSEDMVRRRYFEHDTPEGVDPQARMLAAGYPATNAFTGENLAWGQRHKSSPAEIVDGLMHSRGHRENILRPSFTQVGVGVAMGAPAGSDDVPAATYTTDFGGPPPSYPSARP
jgi:Cysteine-rich secretory protein family